MNEDEKITIETAEESQTEQAEQIKDYYEKAKEAAMSLKTWEEIADVKFLKMLFADKRLSQSDKDFIKTILINKSKQMKMGTEFRKIVALVKKELAKDNEYQRSSYNIINFSDAECAIVLSSRDFYCDENAVYSGSAVVISQPLIISKIFIDVEDYTESVELSYLKMFDTYPKWYTLSVPKEVISNKNKIINLSAYGIIITTQNSQMVSEYLTSLIADNAKYIPVVKGVSRMGYVRPSATAWARCTRCNHIYSAKN